MSEAPPLAVYVHWPYCTRVCPYCDFNVLRDRAQAEQPELAEAIVRDLEGQAKLTGARRLTSVFLGGGTPSLMKPQWAGRIIETARRLWPGDDNVEITLEANPTDAETERFAAFADVGVTRLSLGVQALNDEALAFLGRNHSAAEARRGIDVALKAFGRVSLDMMYARPGQDVDAWRAELGEAAAMGAEHISPYQLTIEKGTAFDLAVKRGEFAPPDDETGAELYETTQAVLAEAGYDAYEVSNHAKGFFGRSVHNLAYWRGWDYLGAGPGAHGRLSSAEGRLATLGEARVADYLAAVAEVGRGFRDSEILTPRQAAIERLFLGLRSSEGVPLADLAFLDLDREAMDEMIVQGFLVLASGKIIATPLGRPLLDRITRDLIA